MLNESLTGANPLIVSAIRLFQHLPREAAEEVAGGLNLRHFTVGEEAVAPGALGKSACFVLSGCIRVSHNSRGGREVILVDRYPGELVGMFEQACLSDARFRITAIEPTCAAFMRYSDLTRILYDNPDVLDRMLSHGMQFSRGLCDRLVELATMKVRHRIYAELLRLAGSRTGVAKTLGVSPVPRHSELASRVNTHREAVTRELGILERAGIIERIDGLLLIHDADYLRDAVCQVC